MTKTSRRSFLKNSGGTLASASLVGAPALAHPKTPGPALPPLAAGGVGPCASTLRIPPPAGSAAGIFFLSPQALTMPGPRIAFQNRDLRLYSLRGSTSFRPRTVTGLKAMMYPPLDLSDPQVAPPLGLSESGFFNLSFREERTGTLIQDIQDEFGDPLYLNQKAESANQLGPVYAKSGASSSILLTQDAQWWPHCYVRTGVFNRRMPIAGAPPNTPDQLISFRIECRTYLSHTADEIYLEIALENRADHPLVLTVIPDQPRPHAEGAIRKPCFVRKEGNFMLEAVSDLGPADNEGWPVTIPALGSSTFRVALIMQPASRAAIPGFHAPDLRRRVESSISASLQQLEDASSALPQLHTANAALDEFYRRSILSVLFCRRDRENFCVRPFYELGFGRAAATAWDTSFSSGLLAQLDPSGLRGMVETFLRFGGALNSTYLLWNGQCSGWYAQSPFSLMRMLNDYIVHTGDPAVLDNRINGLTVLDYLKQAGQEFLTHYARPDGLIDIGAGTGKMLELRTFGYEHAVATINALAVDYFQQLSQWSAQRKLPDAERFASASRKIQSALNDLLWDEAAGWYGNLYPDGSRPNVFSYHLYDMLGTSAIPLDRKRRMATRIREGEFLAPYGMYSIALTDRDHWDLEDCDWGGGGQYVGQPLSIAQNLYEIGESGLAWQVLSRCTQWIERFPYFPQTIYGDSLALQPHQVDWPLQISAGAGAQAIVGGIFGIKPHANGTLTIRPNYNPTLGTATLTNYRFRGHVYTVTLTASSFKITKNGNAQGTHPYGKPVVLSAPASAT